MVTACKNYLTDRGVNRVWDQPRQPLIERLKACLRLNQEYQKCFQRTKRRIAEDPTMRPFEFSEMYIFGKFDTFCKRLNQVWVRNLKSFDICSLDLIGFAASLFNCMVSRPNEGSEIFINCSSLHLLNGLPIQVNN